MKKTLLLVLLVLIDLVLLHGQNPTIKARYEMKDVAGFSGKVGIVESFVLEVGKEKKLLTFSHHGEYTTWNVKEINTFGNEALVLEATFYKEEQKGVGWELVTEDGFNLNVLISPNSDDTNDPREFFITSDDRSIYKIYNEEPDCNSSFTLVEAAESPTLLTGVARTLATIENKKPCGRGRWKITALEDMPKEVLFAFVFSSIQSLNVRYLNDLQK